jgi:hypothetical protein
MFKKVTLTVALAITAITMSLPASARPSVGCTYQGYSCTEWQQQNGS